MRIRRCSLSFALAAALLGLAGACEAGGASPPAAEDGELPELGLMGTVPIYWGEAGDFGELLSGGHAAHWAKAELETGYRLVPLDTLEERGLNDLRFLMLAQPRALSPAENVALDAWVRGGGHLLLFADPLLTGDSRFEIGDRRRPQDVILLSPILGHWGLELRFDDEEPVGVTLKRAATATIPVNLPGSFEIIAGDDECTIAAAGVLARCAIGRGKAVILADAAMLDLGNPHPAAKGALKWLMNQAFGPTRENAGAAAGGAVKAL